MFAHAQFDNTKKKYIENILEERSLTFQRKCSHNWLSISCSSCRASTPYMGNRDSITNSQTPYMGSKDLLAAAYMNSLFVKILLILCTCIYGQQRHAHASLHGLIVCLTNIWILCTWSIQSLTAKLHIYRQQRPIKRKKRIYSFLESPEITGGNFWTTISPTLASKRMIRIKGSRRF